MEFWSGKDSGYISLSRELYESSIEIDPKEETEIYLVRLPFLRELPSLLLVRTKNEQGKYVVRRAHIKDLFTYLLIVSVKAPINYPVSTSWDIGLHVGKTAKLTGPNSGRVLVEFHVNPDCLDHPLICIYTLAAFNAFYQPRFSSVVGPSIDPFLFPSWFDALPEFIREDIRDATKKEQASKR